MKQARSSVAIECLGELFRLPDDVQIVDVRRTDEDLQQGTVTFVLGGSGLPDRCETTSYDLADFKPLYLQYSKRQETIVDFDGFVPVPEGGDYEPV